MGQLNIKDEALIADAKALAEEMGTSVTGVLRAGVQALRAERARAKRLDRDERMRLLIEIGNRVAAMTPPHLRTSDHSDLYDEHGLPK
jgi:hypothetical protein